MSFKCVHFQQISFQGFNSNIILFLVKKFMFSYIRVNINFYIQIKLLGQIETIRLYLKQFLKKMVLVVVNITIKLCKW